MADEPAYSAEEQVERRVLLDLRSFIAKHGTKQVDQYCAQRLHDMRQDRLHWQRQPEGHELPIDTSTWNDPPVGEIDTRTANDLA
jgi:hypothetical protein